MKLIKNIKKLVNNNTQIISKGRWVNLKFILGVDAEDFIFEINCGKIVSIEKRTVFNDLIEEIRKTLRFYMKSNNQSFFNTFYISGGCANIPGLKEFITSNLNVKIEELDIFSDDQDDFTTSIFSEIVPTKIDINTIT